jgi:AcrR family transcriptional regulator
MTGKDARREQILTAAIRLFAEREYHNVQMDEIAVSAAVAKGTLYNHFHSKDALYFEAIRSRLDRLIGLLQQAYPGRREPWRNLRSFLLHWQAFMVREAQFFCLWREALCRNHRPEIVEMHERLRAILREILEQGVKARAFRRVDPDDTATMILGLLDHRAAALIKAGRSGRDPAPILDLLRRGLEVAK